MRILSLCILIVAGLLTPFWCFLLASCVYAILFRSPYEIVCVAICIDIVFGDTTRGIWYLYTMSAGIVFIGFAIMRPYFRFHQ